MLSGLTNVAMIRLPQKTTLLKG